MHRNICGWRSQRILRNCFNICLGELRETTKAITYDSLSLCQYLNAGPPEYEAGVLTVQPWHVVNNVCQVGFSTTVRPVLTLRIEKTASRCRGWLRKFSMSSCGQTTRSGHPSWGLGVELTLHCKSSITVSRTLIYILCHNVNNGGKKRKRDLECGVSGACTMYSVWNCELAQDTAQWQVFEVVMMNFQWDHLIGCIIINAQWRWTLY
jgi:hypothetical protein